MSEIDLQVAKNYLDVIHSADDDKLQLLLDAAEEEALQFMDRDSYAFWSDSCCSSSSEEISSDAALPADVQLGILILLEASYQSSPDDAEQLRKVAETKLMPHRCRLGV